MPGSQAVQSRAASAAAALESAKAEAAEHAAEADTERQRAAEAFERSRRLAEQLDAAAAQQAALQEDKRQVCGLSGSVPPQPIASFSRSMLQGKSGRCVCSCQQRWGSCQTHVSLLSDCINIFYTNNSVNARRSCKRGWRSCQTRGTRWTRRWLACAAAWPPWSRSSPSGRRSSSPSHPAAPPPSARSRPLCPAQVPRCAENISDRCILDPFVLLFMSSLSAWRHWCRWIRRAGCGASGKFSWACLPAEELPLQRTQSWNHI